MMHKINNYFVLIIVFTVSFAVTPEIIVATEMDGEVEGYAWGENFGWINFGCDNCGVYVTDTTLEGYAWSSEYGWINLSPASGGVKNNGAGVLSGFAWSPEYGWIDFNGVVIGVEGEFTGVAGIENGLVGLINFNCDGCEVKTSWHSKDEIKVLDRSAGSRTVTNSQGLILTDMPVVNTGTVPLVTTFINSGGGKNVSTDTIAATYYLDTAEQSNESEESSTLTLKSYISESDVIYPFFLILLVFFILLYIKRLQI